MEKNRIEAFSDGVFAIVITLLILEIKVPHVSLSELNTALISQLPKIYAFILSFIIIGVYWVSHHNMMHFIVKVDRTALWLNMLVLLTVAFIPFPTALLGEYPLAVTPAVYYGITLMLVNFAGAVFWMYTTAKNRLSQSNLSPKFRKRVIILHTSPIVLYFVAILLASYSVKVAYGIFVFVPLFFILPNPLINKILSDPHLD